METPRCSKSLRLEEGVFGSCGANKTLHPKLNGTESQRTPDQVSCDRAIRYSGFFGVCSVGPVGDFLETHVQMFHKKTSISYHWLDIHNSKELNNLCDTKSQDFSSHQIQIPRFAKRKKQIGTCLDVGFYYPVDGSNASCIRILFEPGFHGSCRWLLLLSAAQFGCPQKRSKIITNIPIDIQYSSSHNHGSPKMGCLQYYF